IYLRELPEDNQSFAFTSLAVIDQPLRSEGIKVPLNEAPREAGELIHSGKELSFVHDKILNPSRHYLLQISEKGRNRSKVQDSVVLLKVDFEKFTGTSAVPLSDGIELSWSSVSGANRYEVYADKELTILIGSTDLTKLLFKPTAELSPKNFYVKAFRGALASPDVELITISTSNAKIVKVTSQTAAGVYTVGATLDFEVTFNEKVDMFGTSTLPLITRNGTREATYVGGNRTPKLLYRYIVQAGDNTEELQNGSVLGGDFVDSLGLGVSGALPEFGSNATLAENALLTLDTLSPTAPSSVGFSTALSSTGGFDVSWNAGSDLHFAAHKLMLCSDSACSLSCTAAVSVSGATKTFTAVPEGSYHACVQAVDIVGLSSAYVSSLTQVTVDTTAPQVVRVYGDSLDARYKEGQTIDVAVEFNDMVNVSTPAQLALKLKMTGTDRDAVYLSGSGSSTLKFRYSIVSGDNNQDLDYVSTGSLTKGSGSIKDAAGNNANLTLPVPLSTYSLAGQSALIVDTDVPTAPASVHFAGTTSASTSFSVIWTDSIDPNLKQHNVKICTASNCSTGCISDTTSALSPATVTGVNGTAYYSCVQGEDHLGHLTSWVVSSSTLSVDTSLPGITEVTSTTADGTYDIGETISILVHFTEAVDVVGTSLRLELETGVTNRLVALASGSGTDTLTFDYTVAAGDASQALSYVSVNSLILNGSTIKDATSNDADIALPTVGGVDSLSGQHAIIIDTTAPTNPASVALAGAYSTTSSLGLTWTASVDSNFATHNLKLCTNTLCNAGCVGATTDVSSPGSISGSDGIAYYACVQGVDTLGHTSAWVASSSTGMIDTIAPTVTSVSSTKADGYYPVGTVIPITVTFSEPVTLTTPAGIRLQLETGATDRLAVYESATSTVVTLHYTVVAGDVSSDLDYLATTSLTLGGATILDAAGNAANLTLPALGGGSSIATPKSIVIDTTAPTSPSSVGFSTNVVNTLTFNMSWLAATETNFYRYNTKICTVSDCSSCTSASTSITLSDSMTGADNTTYYGCVQAQDLAGHTSAFVNSVGTMRVDVTAPTVTLVSSTLADGRYKAGIVVPITVQFSETVVVSVGAVVHLGLSPGTAQNAIYSAGSGTNTLTFNYSVQPGDTSNDLDYVATTSLAIVSGTIKDVAGTDATLTLAAPAATGSLGHSKGLVIDTAAPSAPVISAPTNNQFFISNLTSITGTCESGATVEVFSSGVSIGSTTASGTNWTLNLSPSLGDGTYSITAVATDVAGNVGAATAARAFTVDNSGPAIPVITTPAGATNDTTPDISGTSEAGALITLYSATGVSAGTATADGTGNWTVTSSSLSNATYNFTAKATDPGSRVSSASSPVAIKIDTVAPTVASVTSTTTDGTYHIGDTIQGQVTFSEPVFYTAGAGQSLHLDGNAGASNPYLFLTLGSGTATVSGTYTLVSGLSSSDLQYVSTSSLAGTYTDAAGNIAVNTLPATASTNSLGGSKALVIDAVPPAISSITSNLADGAYGPGNVIDIRVTFSKVVNVVGGAPTLTLNTSPVRTASLVSGTGSATLVFNYTVQASDVSSDLNVTNLSLIGATIRDAATNDATLSVPASGAAGSLDLAKEIVIAGNSVAPTISASPASQNAYTLAAIASVNTSASGGTDNDADGQAVTYTCLFDRTANSAMDSGGTACSSLPASAYTFDSSTGVLTWTPTAAAVTNNTSVTTYEFQIRGQDTTHLSGATYFTVSLINPFTASIPYTTSDVSNYSFDAGIELAGDVAKLLAVNRSDNSNSATGFGGAVTREGVSWDTGSSYIRTNLIAPSTCDGRTHNCSGFGTMSWMPESASLVASHSFETDFEGWAAGSGNIEPIRQNTVSKVGHYGLNFLNSATHRLTKARVFTDTFTLNYWFKTSSTIANGGCGTFYHGTALVTAEKSGVLNDWGTTICDGFIMAGPGNPDLTIKTTGRFNDNKWHMVTFTRNMADGVAKLWVDAVLQGTVTGNTNSLNANTNWSIGTVDSATARFDGYFDELNAWSTVLTPNQIAYLFDRQSPNSAGYSVSRVMDSFVGTTNWTGFNWTTTKPFGKEIPDYNSGVQNESAANYNALSNASIHQDLVGLYHLNEATAASAPGGTYFKDSSVSANHGGYIAQSGGANVLVFNQPGRLGKSLYFPGNGAVNLGTSTALDFGNNSFTVAAWFKTHKKDVRLIGSKNGYTNTGTDLALDASGNVFFGVGCPSNLTENDCPYAVTTSKNYADGMWHHAVGVTDKTTNGLRIYVDGNLSTIVLFLHHGSNCATLSGTTELNIASCTTNGNRSSTGFYLGTLASWTYPLTGYLDEVAMWKRVVSGNDIAELYRRGANRLNFQVRSCSTASCTGVAWQGMNGTADSFFSELNNNSAPHTVDGYALPGAPSVTFADHVGVSIGANRYFQYQYVMESDDDAALNQCNYTGGGACSPELRTVTVAGPADLYLTSAPSVTYKVAIPFYTLSGSFTESASCTAGVKYALSIDNSTWKWWDGSAWSTSDSTAAKANTLTQLNANVASFATSVGRTSLYVKALLQSNGSQSCSLDAFGVSGNSAF
ncbi:MAG: hypothetical protein EOP09_00490, partial [Proteobacteria bacterium]